MPTIGHVSIAPYVSSPDDLYELLQAAHVYQGRRLAICLFIAITGLIAALAFPGVVGGVAWIICFVATLNWIGATADYVARGWFMHMLSLRGVLLQPPPADFWGAVADEVTRTLGESSAEVEDGDVATPTVH